MDSRDVRYETIADVVSECRRCCGAEGSPRTDSEIRAEYQRRYPRGSYADHGAEFVDAVHNDGWIWEDDAEEV